MPGLSLGAGAQVRAGAGAPMWGSSPAPTTATEAAYGTAAAPSAATSSLTPTNPAGLAFWIGIAGVTFLVGVYYSLPG
jgi:hypothetical protein